MGKAKGKAKSSRKGKKAWRKNIGTEEEEAFITQAAKDARSGGPLDHLENEKIFFIDKSKDPVIERKIDRYRNKVLRVDSILQRNSLIPPVTVAVPMKKKKKTKKKATADSLIPDVPVSSTTTKKKTVLKKDAAMATPSADAAKTATSPSSAKGSGKKRKQTYDLWDDGGSSGLLNHEDDGGVCTTTARVEEGNDRAGPSSKMGTKGMKKTKHGLPSVEVCQPGCSYNPTFDDHQDALGEAVALEMKSVYERDMLPPPIPMKVLDAEEDVGDLTILGIGGESAGGRGLVEEAEGEPDPELPSRAVKIKKKTKTDLNRKARRRAQERMELERKGRKKMNKDVMRLPEIIKEVKEEDHEQERNRIRRKTVKAERLADGPPKLGKHKFRPAAVQVMMTEELTGSMRTVKGCFTLLRDRYKSLQKRGLIEPRIRLGRTDSKKRKEYEPGSKGRVERLMHAQALAAKEMAKSGGAQVFL